MAWRTADVAIVGAGIHGCSLAFHLTRMDIKRVIVLDKQHISAGGTGKSSGLVQTHYTDDPEARLAARALHYFLHWADLVGGDCGYKRTGYFRLVRPEDDEHLRRNVARLQGLGVNTQVVSREEMREIQPGMHAEDVEVAAYEPDSGFADPASSTQDLMRAARAAGAELVQGARATAVRVANGRVTGVATSQGEIATPVVVVAASVWTRDLLLPLGVDVRLYAERHQVAFVRRPPVFARGHITISDTPLGIYVRQEGEALTLIGTSISIPGEVISNPDHYDQGVSEAFVVGVAEKLSRRFPPFAEAGFLRGHAGFYDVTPDRKPIFGPVPPYEGLYLEAGFSGTGFKFGPAAGEAMAELILTGRAQTVDLTPFRLTRFAEGQPIRGAYDYRPPAVATGE